MNELEKAYIVMQNACEFNVDDTVKVLRKARTHECGWDNSWLNVMDNLIGNSYKITDVNSKGVRLDGSSYELPFFVLEKIPKPHWRDTVSPENPVLCYVRDEEDEDWMAPLAVVEYDASADISYSYRTGYSRYAYAERVPKSMIESMLKAYDETSEDE